MNTHILFDAEHARRAWLVLAILLIILLAAEVTAWLVQRDFGRVDVSNVSYNNYNGIIVRAKLFRPVVATQENPLPGVVYIHGYQNNRETSDAFAIEFARRGFVVLSIDAIGRGNSGIPNDPDDESFDPTYGGRTSLEYLKALPYVDAARVGMMGHSLGAEMAYRIALQDDSVQGLVISGFAYTSDASAQSPKNMLMIIGKFDEYRQRMTGVQDIEKEWMLSPQTQKAIPVAHPQLNTTYGTFDDGTARRVFVPPLIHLLESHNEAVIAEALNWMRQALQPPDNLWINANEQIWHIKEWATLIAMLAGFFSLLPLGLILLCTSYFRALQGPAGRKYTCASRDWIRYAVINGLLMWLYLPLIFMLFGLHVYLIPIDKLFPMMMVNGTVWWFFWINVIGFLFFKRWYKKFAAPKGITLTELGVSFQDFKLALDWKQIGKTFVLASLLFLFALGVETLFERIFIVDYRFLFPFASDLTPYRVLMFFLYLPFLLIGFVFFGMFLHALLRRAKKSSWWKTFLSWSGMNLLATILPLVLFLMIQYIPLLTTGIIPFVGPGGMLASFTMNLFHIIGVLVIVVPISTWFYQLSGKVYLGAMVNAMLVAWMFTSSQVIAPIPV